MSACIFLGKKHQYALGSGPQSRPSLCGIEQKKNLLHLPAIKPWFPGLWAHMLLTILSYPGSSVLRFTILSGKKKVLVDRMLFNGSVSIVDKCSVYSTDSTGVGSLEVLLHVSEVLNTFRGPAQTQQKQLHHIFTNTFRFTNKNI
jgi:hypothetical protein